QPVRVRIGPRLLRQGQFPSICRLTLCTTSPDENVLLRSTSEYVTEIDCSPFSVMKCSTPSFSMPSPLWSPQQTSCTTWPGDMGSLPTLRDHGAAIRTSAVPKAPATTRLRPEADEITRRVKPSGGLVRALTRCHDSE